MRTARTSTRCPLLLLPLCSASSPSGLRAPTEIVGLKGGGKVQLISWIGGD